MLYSLEKKVQKRLEKEVEETEKDVEFAMDFVEENPDVNKAATGITTSSLPKKLFAGFLGISAVYLLWNNLSGNQFFGLVYLFVGYLTARISDYKYSNWRYWFTVVFYLPVVVYGLLPDKLRWDK